MESKRINFEIKEQVAFITLNNPAKLNCIGFQMLYELEEVIEDVEKRADVAVVVFRGAGDRAFSTGADLKEFRLLAEKQIEEWILLGNKVFNKIENIERPTIAYVNGYAMGGGLELTLACDFRIATETAIFCSPELQHGWLPGWGGMTRLRRILGEAKSKEIIIMNKKISANEALSLGLINKIDIDNEKILGQFTDHLKLIKPNVFKLAKYALMETGRTTTGTAVYFDVLATKKMNQ